MTVSPRDIQSPHYCYRAQSYGKIFKKPNYKTNYNTENQLININQFTIYSVYNKLLYND